jgi:CBS domain containing-hemolysin-like protein
MRWRIVIDEHALDLEIRRLLVACIAQEQRLAAVTDEYKRVMGISSMLM